MAEGFEEGAQENNSNGGAGGANMDAIAMVGAVIPKCDSSPHLAPNSISAITTSSHISSLGGGGGSTTATAASLKRDFITESAKIPPSSPSPNSAQQQHQQINHHLNQSQPINLKSESMDLHQDVQSPRGSPNLPATHSADHFMKDLTIRKADKRPSSSISPTTQNHLNGTMSSLFNLQKLQAMSMFSQQQQQQQQHQHHQENHSSHYTTPLNLSVVSEAPVHNVNELGSSLGPLSGALGQSSQLPQLILASGQLLQGIQGAQLLIPTPQGLTTQTILTIPVSQQVGATGPLDLNSNETNNNSHLLNPNLLSTGVQQILSALHPHLFSNQNNNNHTAATTTSGSMQKPSSSPRPTMMSSPSPVNHLIRGASKSPPRSSPSSTSPSINNSHHFPYDKLNSPFPPSALMPGMNSLHYGSRSANSSPNSSQNHGRSHSPVASAMNSINRLTTSSNGELTITKGPVLHANAVAALTASSSSAANTSSPNTSSNPANQHHHISNQGTSNSSSSSLSAQPSHSSQLTAASHHKLGLSPRPMESIASDEEHSEGEDDLLDESPNEPRINQTNSNMVDGIDLDEIKEFAKAFKLRRLSLGLTQTQVGQALSVTEGPAYSQSAICSALAAQMYAAQLSTQQQSMFEKLDITPKSAHKIKPVLERWMKEAEESHWNRYKGNQSHLNDFMGVEPSKKRKRRTSFTPQALELLNAHFERNTHPSGTEITGMAHQLGYEREVIRIWFCNKRQALKNTVRMMSKGMV